VLVSLRRSGCLPGFLSCQRQRHEQVSTHHERFLIGKREAATLSKRVVTRSQSRESHERVEHHIDALKRAECLNSGSAKANFNVGGQLRESRMALRFFIPYSQGLHAKLDSLGNKQLNVAVSGESHHAHRLGVTAHDIERLTTDGAG
jgi:hypothetical protein